jgi:hypothetical protein
MSKFLGYTIGLESNRAEHIAVMAKIEYNQRDDGRISMTVVNGHNLAQMPGGAVVTARAYEARPRDRVAEARWALNHCGWTLTYDDFQASRA